MAYRVQNHAMDLSIPRDTNDALFIQLESQHSPSCIHISRQIPKNELIKLLPESWITNYEKIHEINTPLQSLDSKITKKKMAPLKYFSKKNQMKSLSYLNIPIHSFNSLGDPVYVFKDEPGHKFFDVCDCENCIMTDSDEDAYPRKRDRNKKSSQQILKEKYVSGDPNVVYTPPFEKHSQPLPILPPESSPFGASSFFSTKILEERHIIKKRQSTSKVGGKASTITQIEPPITPNPEDASQFMLEYHNPISSFLTSLAKPKTNKPVTQCSADEILMPEFMMAEPTHVEEVVESDTENPEEQDQPSTHPPPGWNPKKQLLYPGTQLTTVIDRLVSRFYGRLRQWWISLGTYCQLQIRQASTVDAFIGNIHNEFLGAWDHYTTQAREEFLSMKCCSFMRKDLERHYEKMSKRFYALEGMDDVNLKQAYLNSLPEPLGNETARQFSLKSIPLGNATFGELYQTSLAALEKLCNHQKFFKQLQEQGKLLGRACDHPELSIKCKPKKCRCTSSEGRKNKFYKKRWKKRFPRLSENKK
ncbi:hypothetical protein RND81_02G166600 [Saponaria officinalis]|uniref:Uncharacterized protein n=1 Tax=Saponaria officinalis TaxID=3572 RepID=A0AAW1MTW5_SAPOF